MYCKNLFALAKERRGCGKTIHFSGFIDRLHRLQNGISRGPSLAAFSICSAIACFSFSIWMQLVQICICG